MKDIRRRLNSEVDIVRVENGAYRPFKETLSSFLTHIVSYSLRLIMLACKRMFRGDDHLPQK